MRTPPQCPALLVVLLSLATGACQGEKRDGAGQAPEQPRQQDRGGSVRDDQDFITALAGEPYTGFLKVVIQPPGGKSRTRWGTGSASFASEQEGHARLVVFGAIDDEGGDAGFAVDGRYDADGWKATANEVRIEVAPDGAITGGGNQHPQAFRFSGKAGQSDFELVVELELLEDSVQGMPKGTTFSFDYDLSRAEPEDEAGVGDKVASNGGKEKKKCRKIRYEMRPVASIGDGSMSMLRVPVCLQ